MPPKRGGKKRSPPKRGRTSTSSAPPSDEPAPPAQKRARAAKRTVTHTRRSLMQCPCIAASGVGPDVIALISRAKAEVGCGGSACNTPDLTECSHLVVPDAGENLRQYSTRKVLSALSQWTGHERFPSVNFLSKRGKRRTSGDFVATLIVTPSWVEDSVAAGYWVDATADPARYYPSFLRSRPALESYRTHPSTGSPFFNRILSIDFTGSSASQNASNWEHLRDVIVELGGQVVEPGSTHPDAVCVTLGSVRQSLLQGTPLSGDAVCRSPEASGRDPPPADADPAGSPSSNGIASGAGSAAGHSDAGVSEGDVASAQDADLLETGDGEELGGGGADVEAGGGAAVGGDAAAAHRWDDSAVAVAATSSDGGVEPPLEEDGGGEEEVRPSASPVVGDDGVAVAQHSGSMPAPELPSLGKKQPNLTPSLPQNLPVLTGYTTGSTMGDAPTQASVDLLATANQPSAGPPPPFLTLEQEGLPSDAMPSVIVIDKDEMLLGRGSGAVAVDVRLNSLTIPNAISRRHARFFRTLNEDGLGYTVVLVDQKSTNGFFVNGVKQENAVLCDGDIVTFGGGSCDTAPVVDVHEINSDCVYRYHTGSG